MILSTALLLYGFLCVGGDELPMGNWSFTTGFAHDARDPAILTKIVTNSRNGLEVAQVTVKNRTGRVLESVRLEWMLVSVDPETGKTVVEDHVVAKESIVTHLLPNSEEDIKDRITSFATLAPHSVTDDDYILYLGIREANFPTGTYTTQAMDDIANFGKPPEIISRAFCPQQECKWVNNGSGSGYICRSVTSQSTWCKIEEQGSVCINSSCDSGEVEPL